MPGDAHNNNPNANMKKCMNLMAALACAVLVMPAAMADEEDVQETVLKAAGSGSSGLLEVLSRGININAADDDGNTALMEASEKGEYSTVRALLDAGADVNAVNEDGETALMLASEEGNTAIVRMLLDAGADPDARDEDGETAYDKTDSDDTTIRDLLRRAEPPSHKR